MTGLAWANELVFACPMVYYPYMASIVGKKRGSGHLLLPGGVGSRGWQAADHVSRSTWVLRRSWQRRCAAAGSGCPTGFSIRTSARSRRPGECWRISAWPPSSTRQPGRGAPRRPLSVGHISGAGRAEPGGGTVLQARLRGLVGHDGGAPVHPDSGLGAGSPAVLGRDACRHAGAAGGGQPRRSRCASCEASGVDVSSVALDMTNFATFIDTANQKAPVAQRGKARQKRSDLRLVGPGPGGHPRRRDPADLARLPRQPARRHPVRRDDRPAPPPVRGDRHRCRAAGPAAAEMTVVFDAGQNSEDNFALSRRHGTALHRVGARPATAQT